MAEINKITAKCEMLKATSPPNQFASIGKTKQKKRKEKKRKEKKRKEKKRKEKKRKEKKTKQTNQKHIPCSSKCGFYKELN